MTEADWPNFNIIDRINYFECRGSNRRRRLFACACCRRVWDLLIREIARQSVGLAEDYADGKLSVSVLESTSNHTDFADLQLQLTGGVKSEMQLSLCTLHAIAATKDLLSPTVSTLQLVLSTSCDLSKDYMPSPLHNENTGGGSISVCRAELLIKDKLLRDIFGNPFRPVTFDPAWRTTDTVGIAAKMYDERNFDAMPILADALQDAGCENEDIIQHCLSGGPHVRGCWVVDSILGKT